MRVGACSKSEALRPNTEATWSSTEAFTLTTQDAPADNGGAAHDREASSAATEGDASTKQGLRADAKARFGRTALPNRFRGRHIRQLVGSRATGRLTHCAGHPRRRARSVSRAPSCAAALRAPRASCGVDHDGARACSRWHQGAAPRCFGRRGARPVDGAALRSGRGAATLWRRSGRRSVAR